MSMTGRYFLVVACLCVCLQTFSQENKIAGRWKPVRMIAETYPEGMDINVAEKMLYQSIKENAEKQNKVIQLDAEDSASVKQKAKEVLNEVFQNIYFRFNPDNTCYFNFGKLLDETEMEGTIVKGKYKINEEAKSILVITDKDQRVAGKETKIKKDKVVFYYSFNKDQLRLELDDGSLIFYLMTEK